ncbi:hypothetical protein V8F20_002268 [Naviculisporaceae sp. PSN 640]
MDSSQLPNVGGVGRFCRPPRSRGHREKPFTLGFTDRDPDPILSGSPTERRLETSDAGWAQKLNFQSICTGTVYGAVPPFVYAPWTWRDLDNTGFVLRGYLLALPFIIEVSLLYRGEPLESGDRGNGNTKLPALQNGPLGADYGLVSKVVSCHQIGPWPSGWAASSHLLVPELFEIMGCGRSSSLYNAKYRDTIGCSGLWDIKERERGCI